MRIPELSGRVRLAAVLMITVVAVSAYALPVYFSTTSSTSPSYGQYVTQNSTGATGLEVISYLSQPNVTAGQNITISVQVFNTRYFLNSVATSNVFPKLSNPTDFAMGFAPANSYGVAVAAGNFTAKTLSDASSLNLLKPAVYAGQEVPHVSQYQFLPRSTNANEYSGYSFLSYQQSADLTGSLSIHGYWTGSLNDPVFHDFKPGIYTVVAADEWGQFSLIHFVVTR